MNTDSFIPFSKSIIWSANAAYYQNIGMDAWRDGEVPHHLTSNAFVGNTYAEMIFATLKEQSLSGQTDEIVYVFELGAGHGRLCYHTLVHLDNLINQSQSTLPPYCFVLTDIVEKNLDFFISHPQFQSYLKEGKLDVAYFDATKSDQFELRYSQKSITKHSLKQASIIIANYFFDSIPTDVFQFIDKDIYACNVKNVTPEKQGDNDTNILNDIQLLYKKELLTKPYYTQQYLNEILHSYKSKFENTHIFFPVVGLECIERILDLSMDAPTVLLCIDKGYQNIKSIDNHKEPDLISHGSFSTAVNFNIYSNYCKLKNGIALNSQFASESAHCICYIFKKEDQQFLSIQSAFENHINTFGPDDFNSIKHFALNNAESQNLIEIISFIRLSNYDSTMLVKYLPRIKALIQNISMDDRGRIFQTLNEVWKRYFTIGEKLDLSFEMACMYQDLSYYPQAVFLYSKSTQWYGDKPDNYFNTALCLYQMRKDEEFKRVINKGKSLFPDYKKFSELDKLNLAE